jgi:hypothetical protein
MTWVSQNIRYGRVIMLALSLLAWIGPWAYDRINVPAQYPCSPPFVRLEGDYCGAPVPGGLMLGMVVMNLGSLIAGLAGGLAVFAERGREFTISLLGLLLALPTLTTLFLVVWRGENRRALLQALLWLAALGISLLLVLSVGFERAGALWGVYLFIIVAAAGLLLESAALLSRKDAV